MAYLDTAIKAEDLAPNSSLCVTLGERQVGLFRTAEGLFAINNVCPHKGAPLHDGFVREGTVTCPWHAWCFRLDDGKMTLGDLDGVDAFAVRVDGDTVSVARSPKTS